MSVVNPSFRKPHPPTLPEVMDSHKRDTQKSIKCAQPGIIQAFYPGDNMHAPTADVLIAQQQVTSVQPDGTKTFAAYPLLKGVPVYFTGGGGYTMTYPVAQNDECLLVFCDRELDNWLEKGGGLAPITGRLHDISDAIAYVGIRSNPRALANISTSAVQLRSDNFTNAAGAGECIQIAPGRIDLIADEVVIHGRNKTTFDAGGTGFVYTPGLISTYTDGVPGTNSGPTPPEVPT